MSDRKFGLKLIGIILLGFAAVNFLISFVLKFANLFFVSGVSLSQPYVEEIFFFLLFLFIKI